MKNTYITREECKHLEHYHYVARGKFTALSSNLSLDFTPEKNGVHSPSRHVPLSALLFLTVHQNSCAHCNTDSNGSSQYAYIRP